MKEKDPFEKYDKLFDKQDKEHDQQVKEYRNEVKVKANPSFDDLENDQIHKDEKNKKQSSQIFSLVVSIFIGVAILRSIFLSDTFFGSLIPAMVLLGIVISVVKNFKNKR